MRATAHRLLFPLLSLLTASVLLWLDKLSSPGWVGALAVIAAGYYTEGFFISPPPEAKKDSPGPHQPSREFEE